MGSKRFQVPSNGTRLQALLVTPELGDSWPWVVLNHAGRSPKDATFFDGFVEPLVERGFAVCRYDPRAPQSDFWARWSDLSAVLQHVARDYPMPQTALAGAGLGAVLSVWWAAVHKCAAVVCFGLPVATKVGAVPKVMHDYLPPSLAENAVVPHPTHVDHALVLVSDRDPDGAQRAEGLGATVDRIPGADKHFAGVRARQVAFERSAAWLASVLRRPAHEQAGRAGEPQPVEERRSEEPSTNH